MASKWLVRLLVVLPVWWADIAPLRAAQTEAGSAQAVGYGGLVAGIGTHGSLGGGVTYAATKRILAVGEFSYIPGGCQKVAGEGFAAKASARAYDFNGGIHFQFPLKDPKAVPYVGAGVGVLHGSAAGTTTVLGQTYSSRVSGTDFYFNLGGGLRYYVSNWVGHPTGAENIRRRPDVRSFGHTDLLPVREVRPPRPKTEMLVWRTLFVAVLPLRTGEVGPGAASRVPLNSVQGGGGAFTYGAGVFSQFGK